MIAVTVSVSFTRTIIVGVTTTKTSTIVKITESIKSKLFNLLN
jgi:hypothetical protein